MDDLTTTTTLDVSVPVHEERARTLRCHDVEWVDEFDWYRDDPDALRAALAAETAHTAQLMATTDAFASDLVASAGRGLLDSELGLPQRQGSWWFVTTLEPGAQFPRVFRVPAVERHRPPSVAEAVADPAAELLVDFDAEFSARPPASVGGLQLSPCGRWVTWTEDATGGERYTLVVRRHGRGPDAAGAGVGAAALTGIGPRVTFSACGDFVFVLRLSATNRPAELWRYRTEDLTVGTLVLRSDDERFRLRVERSLSDAYLFVTATSRSTSRHWVLPADEPEGEPRPLPELPEDTSASLAHLRLDGEDLLLITLTSPDAPNSELVLAPVPGPDEPGDPSSWVPVLPHAPSDRLSPALALDEHVLVGRKRDGLNEVLVARPARDASGRPVLPFRSVDAQGGRSVRLLVGPDRDSRTLVLSTSSYVAPPLPFLVDLDDPELRPRPLDADADEASVRSDAYAEERHWAVSHDGTRVPLTIVYRRDVHRPDAPALLTGYGAYGTSIEPSFNPMLLSLLDLGMVYAVAHVRGGGERGQEWHDGARGTRKQNSFLDFIACRDHLVEQGWASAGRVACQGGSAGGLLVAAVLNLAPEKFAAALLDVPFVDPLTTMLHPELPLTVSDRRELGDPIADPAVFAAMRAYTPYANIRAERYPPVLATCGVNDTRVSPLEALKWVARLRRDALGGPFLLRCHDSGHLGGGGIDDALTRVSQQYAWVAQQLGVADVRLPTSDAPGRDGR